MPRIGPLRPVALSATLVAPGQTAVARHAAPRATGAATDVPLPPLPAGQHMLPHFALHQHPPDADWRETTYRAATPWMVDFHDVAVFGDAGLIAAGDELVADTAGRADPVRDRFHATRDGVILNPLAAARRLRGTCLSLLGPGADSIYHWTIDGIGRLAAAADLAGITDLLLPAGLGPVQRDLLARAGLPPGLRVHHVAPGDLLRVDRLVLPWSIERDFSIGGAHRPHPCIAPYFATVTAAGPAPPGPKRVYIDRRASPNRRLANQDAVIAALSRFGFVPVRLELLAAAAQIGIFAHAEAIVAPHGAGLAHLVHARPGTPVLELHAAHWVNWCFRRHAAVLGLRYDCLAGPPLAGIASDHVNTRPWAVSPLHLQAAVAGMLDGA